MRSCRGATAYRPSAADSENFRDTAAKRASGLFDLVELHGMNPKPPFVFDQTAFFRCQRTPARGADEQVVEIDCEAVSGERFLFSARKLENVPEKCLGNGA